MSYNVMILSVGRRVELVKRFKRAAKELKIKSEIVGVDISDLAPALYFCDEKELVPRISDEKYIPSLLDICKKYDIKLIVPTIDTELLKISENVNRFNELGVLVNISTPDVIKICRNKKNTSKWLEENNIDAPRMITEDDLENHNYQFPLFIKPLDGSSSINAFKVENQKSLDFFVDYVPNPIIQEMVFGEEYTIDAFCDFEGNPITIVPRKRLAVRAGEILKGIIDKDEHVINAVKELIKKLKPYGHITIQCIKSEDGKVNIIEINPRFGGGAPMSIDAGADSPKNLYMILMGKKLKYNEDYKDKLYFSRFDDAIMIDQNEK